MLGLTVMAFVATFDVLRAVLGDSTVPGIVAFVASAALDGWRVRLVARLIHWTDELRPKR